MQDISTEEKIPQHQNKFKSTHKILKKKRTCELHNI